MGVAGQRGIAPAKAFVIGICESPRCDNMTEKRL